MKFCRRNGDQKEVTACGNIFLKTPFFVGSNFNTLARAKTEKLLKSQNYNEETFQEDEYKFTIVQGKERIIQIMKSQHDNSQQAVHVLSTLSRWLQIIHYCLENYRKALKRGVEYRVARALYRVVLEKPAQKIEFAEDVQNLLAEPNFELKLTQRAPSTNLAIFDQKEATFNVFPAKSLAESPIIWTNNPSFLTICQDHFKLMWQSSRTYKPE